MFKRLSILEEKIEVSINSFNVHHYEKVKGYYIPRRKTRDGYNFKKGTTIIVDISDLPDKSNVKVTKICDLCNAIVPNQSYNLVMTKRKRLGIDICKDCSYQFASNTKINSVKYEKSLEHNAIVNNKHHLIDEYSDKNKKKPCEITYRNERKVLWNCPVYGDKHEYNMSVANRVGGRNCPYCAGKRVNDTNCLNTTHPEHSSEWNYELNIGRFNPFNITCNKHILFWWTCSECNQNYKMSVANKTKDKRGCECSKSKTVKIIIRTLENHKVNYETEYKFDDCVYEKRLPFDFALFNKDRDLICLIEYDGEHHTYPVKFNGISEERAIEDLKNTKLRDNIKSEYCNTNSIHLHRIDYTQKDHVIELTEDILYVYGLIDIGCENKNGTKIKM